MNEPFSNRRQALNAFLAFLTFLTIPSPRSPTCFQQPLRIRDFLKKQIDSGLEGIVTKRLDSPYIPRPDRIFMGQT